MKVYDVNFFKSVKTSVHLSNLVFLNCLEFNGIARDFLCASH